LKPDKINSYLESIGTSPLRQGVKLIELLTRPQVSLEKIQEAIPALKEQLDMIPNRTEETIESANIKIKYEGYIKREKIIADKITRLEDIKIQDRFNYNGIQSLSTEAREKLTAINPETIAQASRIPGVSPNDISVLLVLLGR
jgi:tRNA uridine 5-carboxymethylaminomethyl modification enzyme